MSPPSRNLDLEGMMDKDTPSTGGGNEARVWDGLVSMPGEQRAQAWGQGSLPKASSSMRIKVPLWWVSRAKEDHQGHSRGEAVARPRPGLPEVRWPLAPCLCPDPALPGGTASQQTLMERTSESMRTNNPPREQSAVLPQDRSEGSFMSY